MLFIIRRRESKENCDRMKEGRDRKKEYRKEIVEKLLA